MTNLATLDRWLSVPTETENLEFKEAKEQFEKGKLLKYCAAIANEGGGHLVLGVSDKPPRKVVGSKAFLSPQDLAEKKSAIIDKLGFRVETVELEHANGRVLVFDIPSRPQGYPIGLDGTYFMRSGDELIAMTPDQLKRILDEGQPDWFMQPSKSGLSPDEVIGLLDTQAYFDLMKLPYPTNRDGVLERLRSESLISHGAEGYSISNLAAILLAKKLESFSAAMARKAARVIIYEGKNKLKTRTETVGARGYAVGFEGLVDFIYNAAPKNQLVEENIREDVKMFPKQALRELIANALVHQDFLLAGSSVMIEMYDDRIEISNPGTPPIKVERFIDEYLSRNETLADLMRRMGICEEKGSGVDKVVDATERNQLPAPGFRVGDRRTTAILYAHKEFVDMSKEDRMWATYMHCCLKYLSNERMSNQTLRDRFHLPVSKQSHISLLITATKDAGLIKSDDTEIASTRYARYLPFWA